MIKNRNGAVMGRLEELQYHERTLIGARDLYNAIQTGKMSLGLIIPELIESLTTPSRELIQAIEKAEVRIEQLKEGV